MATDFGKAPEFENAPPNFGKAAPDIGNAFDSGKAPPNFVKVARLWEGWEEGSQLWEGSVDVQCSISALKNPKEAILEKGAFVSLHLTDVFSDLNKSLGRIYLSVKATKCELLFYAL